MTAEELLEKYAKGERDFKEKNIKGHDLSNAQLRDVNLSGASWYYLTQKHEWKNHPPNFSGANLENAKFVQTDLAGSNLTEANLTKADLTEASIDSADLQNANLQGADLTEADLDSADLQNASLQEANLTKIGLENANLENANLQRANLTKASLKSANLEKANLEEADLKLTDISNSNLSEANLTNAYLVGAELVDANLRKACLEGANLEAANLENADLIRANLNGANLRKADLTDANIYGATFDNADLTDAIMPDGEIYNLETSTTKQPNRRSSMERQIIKTDSAPAPVGPYNQAIAATGKMLFVSGQIAIDTRLNEIVYTDDVAKQTEQVMNNLEAILLASGAQWSNVVKTTVFLKDMNDFATVNGVYAKYFDADTAPARACVEVSRLPKDVLVEIDCIAVL